MCSDGTVRVPLRARDGSVRAYTLVDAADAEWVNQWRWCFNEGYASRTGTAHEHPATIYLHRELLNRTASDRIEIDHINRDKLDNRRSNLRVTTKAQNMQNRVGRTASRSQYRGVWWDKVPQRWKAEIKVNGVKQHIGSFTDEHAAGRAAREARLRHMPFATD